MRLSIKLYPSSNNIVEKLLITDKGKYEISIFLLKLISHKNLKFMTMHFVGSV